MENKIKVSVIVPVYEVENYLERTVDSLLAQTFEDMEIILVDDGSTDSSGEICDRLKEEHPEKIRVIHKENQGLGLARNSGIEIARGDYIAFVDSDDTVEPQMYEELYQKAKEGGYDIVMCDVCIIREEENTRSVSKSFPLPYVEPADYIANGNNITYSVNKLYRREIWEENRYEKMLFEDIALVPALVTRYPNIGYVPKAFYNYYRRANTLSTTFTGNMGDIIQAFRLFLDRSSPDYREEVVYCAAKQIYWNMFQSRTLFQADFMELVKEYETDFRMNPYLEKDKKTGRILIGAEREVIPETFICVSMGNPVSPAYWEGIRTDFPKARVIEAAEDYFAPEELPRNVRRAKEEGKTLYVQEYYALKILYREGGIVAMPWMRVSLNLKRLRQNRVFFGFQGREELETGCFGAQKEHYVIKALLNSYEQDSVYNKGFLPLGERLRDFLIVHFGLKSTGKSQLLKKEVQVYLPSVLSYDMKNGENCCKKEIGQLPSGYEAVSEEMLAMWSEERLENWRLYKEERDRKGAKKEDSGQKAPAASGFDGAFRQELEERIQEVVDTYENSTCWKITKPIRVIGRWFGKEEGL